MPLCLSSDLQSARIDLGPIQRLAAMITPERADDLAEEVSDTLLALRSSLDQQAEPMTVTIQTVFLRRAEDVETCRRLFRAHYGARMPATSFVIQPPCGGQALAVEAWAVGGQGVEVRFPQPDVVTVSYDNLRWVYVGGVSATEGAVGAYAQSRWALGELAARLDRAGASFSDVVRTWLYMGGIVADEAGTERYRELNRARTDFFQDQIVGGRMLVQRGDHAFYPASTGIGTLGNGVTMACVALQTRRQDVRLQPLENPLQTSAFQYAQRFSAKSPKFSRGMAVVIGRYATTWVSGTASIVNSESVHLGDVARQTEQTIDNIERLISGENFARHGIADAGARLSDLAKIRVYVKHPEDYETCRAVCQRRFGAVPAIFAQADVCRSELLVEIEGVAFSSVGDGAS